MREVHLDDLILGTQGQILHQGPTFFSGIGTDTRQNLQGQLFWALKGETFDAHQFINEARKQGAVGLVIQEVQNCNLDVVRGMTVILVKDTLRALQEYARHVRRQKKWTVIGITGSNGKTTSKEFTQAVLEEHFHVHSNKGSYNNHFGLPFNLLCTPDDAEVVVAEMGMNHSGEIKALCQIAEPNLVVCSMVGRGHIEHFGSIERIAAAKEEIYQWAPAEATRIYNLDNEWTQKMYQRAHGAYPEAAQILTFSGATKADVVLELQSMTAQELVVRGSIGGLRGQARIGVFGEHNLTNLRVAAALALALRVPPEKIWKSLENCKTSWGRNQFISTESGAEILFDAYNANPDSMAALLSNLKILKNTGKRIGYFAEMLELGEYASQAHRQLGQEVGRSGFDVVSFYGAHAADFAAGLGESKFSKKQYISDSYQESLASEIASMLSNGDLALVKGSRGMKLERFVRLCRPLNFETK